MRHFVDNHGDWRCKFCGYEVDPADYRAPRCEPGITCPAEPGSGPVMLLPHLPGARLLRQQADQFERLLRWSAIGVALLMFTVGLSQLLLGCAQQRTDWGALAKGVATVQDRHR